MADSLVFFDSPAAKSRFDFSHRDIDEVEKAILAMGNTYSSEDDAEPADVLEADSPDVTPSSRIWNREDVSPRSAPVPVSFAATSAKGTVAVTNATPQASYLVTHPQKWTEEQVLMWWQKRTKKRKDFGTPSKGTDGRNIMRWTIARFEQLCNGNNGMATALYQDLRNEIDRFEQYRRSGAIPPEPGRLGVLGADDPLASPRSISRTRHRATTIEEPSARLKAQEVPKSSEEASRRQTTTSVSSGPRGVATGNPPEDRSRIRLAPCSSKLAQARAAAAEAKPKSFNFNPGQRMPDVSPAARASVRQGVPSLAATAPSRGASTRNKSAPRVSRSEVPKAHTSDAGSSAHPRTSQVVTQKQVPRAIRRSLEMEDLGDETLAQMSTPKKKDFGNLQDEMLEFEAPRRSVRATSMDDSDINSRQRANKPQGAQADEDGDLETRRMFDKRELRRRNKVLFDQQLTTWRSAKLHTGPSSSSESATSRVRVCVRKRPLFGYEWEADEFDVISVRGKTEVIVHNCLTKADLRSLFVSHMGFNFTHAFGEKCTDDEVYASCAAPAVHHAQLGGVATLFMFGQTGSGKTHTMSGLIRRTADQLFSNVGTGSDDVEPDFSLTAFEIAGKNMRDLLDSSPKELKVMEDKDHRTQVLGARSMEVQSAEHLLELLASAQAHRATRATQVNDTSSRSHAVFRVRRPVGRGLPDAVLTLVDCAGSERREDSSHHDVQTRKDAAEINSTIFALKECFRVMRSSKGQQPPYRDSLLTRVLSDSFSSERAMIVAIGTVSPSATDTEHSIGTLRALQQLQGTTMTFEEREDVVKPKSHVQHPSSWSADEVKVWFESAIGGAAKPHAGSLSRGTDGKNLLRWPLQRFTQLCGGDEDLAMRLYQDLRLRIRAAG